MEKYYKVSESELLELLTAQCTLIALENGGVDNWEWYGDSIQDWVEIQCQENGIKPFMEVVGQENADYVEDTSVRDIAHIYLQDYQEVE